MKYYVFYIEQWTQAGAETPTENAKVEKKNTLDAALSRFYEILKTAADTPAYNFLDARIVQSDGGIIKRDTYGKYIETASSES